MPDLSSLFSSMAMPEREDDPKVSAIVEALAKVRERQAELDSRENQTLERMGMNTVERRKQDLMDANKPKGVMGNIMQGATEFLGGLAGRAPYSDRFDTKARQQMQLETPIDSQILNSITSQRNRSSMDEARLADAAERMGLKLEDLGLKREGTAIKRDLAGTAKQVADTREKTRLDNASLIPNRMALMTAQAGKNQSGTALDYARSGMVTQQTKDLENRDGLTGEDANNNVLSKQGQERVDKIFGIRQRKADMDAAKTLGGKYAPGSATAGLAGMKKIVGQVVDENTGMNALQDREGNFYASDGNPNPIWVPKVTGENAGAASRAASGYRQVDQIFPIIDKVGPKMGLIRGTFEDWMKTARANDDPDIQLLYGYLDSISKFAAGIHGMRAREAAKDIFNSMRNMRTNPEAFKASIIAVKKAFGERGLAIPGASTYFRQEGMDMEDVRKFVDAQGMDALNVKSTPIPRYQKPKAQVNGMPVPAQTPGAATSGTPALTGKAAADYLENLGKK